MLNRFMGSVVLSAILLTGITGCGSSSSTTCGDKDATVVTPATTTTTTTDDNISATDSSTDSLKSLVSGLETASAVAITASLVNVEDDDKMPFGDGSFSPFERVAVLDVVRDAEGNVDYNATNKKASELATKIALSVANVDEPKIDPATFKASNWIVIDKKKVGDVNLTAEDIKHHLIHIPTSKPFNPNEKYSPTNTNKVHLVELCNPDYAAQAVGHKMVGGEKGAKVPNGAYHTTALPCEVTVYTDNKAIYVDMLNPETIFTLFFTEVFSHEVMENKTFKIAMMALPTQVKKEVTALVHNALDATGETYTKTAIKMGPIYSSFSKAMAIPETSAPYKHLNYTGDKAYTVTDAKNIATEIMKVMTIHGKANAGNQDEPLLSSLPSMAQSNSVQPKWRSARDEPFKVPGGIWVVEACSPVYAKEALNTGEHHTPALPCEIAININPDNNQSINVAILNPDFMFNALFADGMADMNQSAITEFENIIDNINGDLEMMVDYAVEHNIEGLDHATKKELTPIDYSK